MYGRQSVDIRYIIEELKQGNKDGKPSHLIIGMTLEELSEERNAGLLKKYNNAASILVFLGHNESFNKEKASIKHGHTVFHINANLNDPVIIDDFQGLFSSIHIDRGTLHHLVEALTPMYGLLVPKGNNQMLLYLIYVKNEFGSKEKMVDLLGPIFASSLSSLGEAHSKQTGYVNLVLLLCLLSKDKRLCCSFAGIGELPNSVVVLSRLVEESFQNIRDKQQELLEKYPHQRVVTDFKQEFQWAISCQAIFVLLSFTKTKPLELVLDKDIGTIAFEAGSVPLSVRYFQECATDPRKRVSDLISIIRRDLHEVDNVVSSEHGLEMLKLLASRAAKARGEPPLYLKSLLP